MNFDFSDDQKLLQQTARDYLAEHAPLAVCREILEGDAPYAEALWKGAAEMGWQGAVIPEEYGGAGFGYLELVLIAEEVGRALAPIPFSSSVYFATEALLRFGSEDQKKKRLPGLASGDVIGTYALTEKPGQQGVEHVEAKVEQGKLTGTKSPVPDGESASFAVVAAQGEGGLGLHLVNLTGDGVTRKAIDAFDPTRPLTEISFDGAPAELLGEAGEGAAQADALLDRVAVLMAFEQLGAATRSFELTKAFVEGRYAFGRPIASFQAIKHRLADLYCEVELARSSCFYGAWALEGDEPELGVAACQSRVQASEALNQMSIEMIQLYGGVGYTWEYDCHLFYRRARSLAAALGTPNAWRNKRVDRVDFSDDE
jgi:alkylation response protein AidB-like acyl-CoA dehydrogenase